MIIPFEIVYIFLSTVYMKLRNLGHALKKNCRHGKYFCFFLQTLINKGGVFLCITTLVLITKL